MNEQRRHWLRQAGAAGLVLALADWPATVRAQTLQRPDTSGLGADFPAPGLFDASDAALLRQQLGVVTASAHAGLELNVTPTAEIALQVPVLMRSRIPGTTALALLVERNPTPLVAWFAISPGLRPQLQLHIKMAETTDVELYAWANDQVYVCRQQVEVIHSGCD